jgi:hypothetical protein
MSEILRLRNEYHHRICRDILGERSGILNNADRGSKTSQALARGIAGQLPYPLSSQPPSGQTTGSLFEQATTWFLQESFRLLEHIRPGKWGFFVARPQAPPKDITHFEQYEHLALLSRIISDHPGLAAVLGAEYLVKPDILIGRYPLEDAEINAGTILVQADGIPNLTPLRKRNRSAGTLLLHASISCKWTIRSDRSQNTRTEALNLIRNRKGHTPHIVAVTAEPMPTRIASLALGTGDIDCVYHFALTELLDAVRELDNESQQEMLETLIEGRRLRDIADLPFDLVI